MSFENKHFGDGEVTFSVPAWRRTLEELDAGIGPTDFQKNAEKRHIQADEVGLRHPKNGSFLRIADDGTIEAFTAYGTGLRIKRDHTIQIFADRLQAVGRTVDVHAGPNGGLKHDKPFASYPETRGLSFEALEAIRAAGRDTYGTEEWK